MARGMTCAYPSIVTPHGEILHSERYDLPLAAGDLLLADVGAETPGGWAGDVTRIWPVSGRFSTTQRDALRGRARRAAAGHRRGAPGQPLPRRPRARLPGDRRRARRSRHPPRRPDRARRRRRGRAPFPHGVGHLLGLDVHDMEDLGDRAGYAPGRERASGSALATCASTAISRPGMAVTIEPGFYIVPGHPRRPGAHEGRGRSPRPRAARALRRGARHPHRRRRARDRDRARGAHARRSRRPSSRSKPRWRRADSPAPRHGSSRAVKNRCSSPKAAVTAAAREAGCSCLATGSTTTASPAP